MRFFTLLSLFFYTNLSLALGLGDAELKSNLGEKFLAKINITDVESQPESNCFSASDTGDIPAFKKAMVTLKPINGNYQLTISTSEVITEPIVNLRVSFHCEPNINREYVLLLDPVPLPAIEKTAVNEENPDAEPVSVANKQHRKARQTSDKNLQAHEAEQQTDEIVPDWPVFKKSVKKKKKNAATSVDARLLEAYTGKQNTLVTSESSTAPENKSAADTPVPHKSTDKPYLVISPGSANANEGANKPSLSLRLATEIDVTRPDEVMAPQTVTDAMDEVTVMSNRLMHLEKQITDLQARNAQLVADAQKAKEENASYDWLQFLKIALGVIVALAGAEWLRRKLANRQAQAIETWFDEEKTAATSFNINNLTDDPDQFDSSDTDTPSFDKSNFDDLSSRSSSFADANAMIVIEKEDYGNILDDADVFIEHGRPKLAIQLLQNHLSETPAESPAIWLKLLNLLAKEATESEYDEAVVECNKHFNIKAAKFGDNPIADNSSIEDYPHIISRLEGVWGSPYAVGFLNDLIFNKRSQPREGLDQGAFNDLFFLRNIAKKLELSNSSTYRSGSSRTDSGQPNVINPNQENINFNDALFTDTEHLDDVNTAPKNKLDDTKFDSKANFDAYHDESSYEVKMISSDDVPPGLETQPDALEFDLPPQNSIVENEKSIKAQEINFSLPVEKVDYAPAAKDAMLNEEIVLDSSEKAALDKNTELDFSLDFPDTGTAKEDSPKVKSKTRTKAKSAAKNQPVSNEIEWDLPEINPESDK